MVKAKTKTKAKTSTNKVVQKVMQVQAQVASNQYATFGQIVTGIKATLIPLASNGKIHPLASLYLATIKAQRAGQWYPAQWQQISNAVCGGLVNCNQSFFAGISRAQKAAALAVLGGAPYCRAYSALRGLGKNAALPTGKAIIPHILGKSTHAAVQYTKPHPNNTKAFNALGTAAQTTLISAATKHIQACIKAGIINW